MSLTAGPSEGRETGGWGSEEEPHWAGAGHQQGRLEVKVSLIHLMKLPGTGLAETEHQLTATHAVSH